MLVSGTLAIGGRRPPTAQNCQFGTQPRRPSRRSSLPINWAVLVWPEARCRSRIATVPGACRQGGPFWEQFALGRPGLDDLRPHVAAMIYEVTDTSWTPLCARERGRHRHDAVTGPVPAGGPAAGGLVGWAERSGRQVRQECRAGLRSRSTAGCPPRITRTGVTSLARQLDQAGALVAGHGQIVARFLDAGQSRTLAWARHPQAAALVAQLADPDPRVRRGRHREYGRAFYGGQYAARGSPAERHEGNRPPDGRRARPRRRNEPVTASINSQNRAPARSSRIAGQQPRRAWRPRSLLLAGGPVLVPKDPSRGQRPVPERPC